MQGFASSNPGMVKLYLVDDAGNTSCSSLSGWATQNSITTNAVFDNAGNVIKMTDYGTAGMPKCVVLGGGTCHTVYYNANDVFSTSDIQTAITNALTPCTGVIENNNLIMKVNVFPNPVASNSAVVNYILNRSADVNIDVVNVVGEKVSTVSLGNQPAGKQEYRLNLESFSEGVYFIKLSAGKTSQTTKLTVIH